MLSGQPQGIAPTEHEHRYIKATAFGKPPIGGISVLFLIDRDYIRTKRRTSQFGQ